MIIQRVLLVVLNLAWGIFFYLLINTNISDKLDSMGDNGMFPLLIPIALIFLSIYVRFKIEKDELNSDDKQTIVFLWIFGAFLVLPGIILAFRGIRKKASHEKVETSDKGSKKISDKHIFTNIEVQKIIKNKGLRPLGNKKRLTHTDNQYNVRLLLFADKNDSETYYKEFIKYAEKHPPAFCIEIMHVKIKTIYDEPFGLVFPYERIETRQEYAAWLKKATLSCNEVLRNFQSADHSYEMLNQYVSELFSWTILVPDDFDPDSSKYREIFTDPENGGFDFKFT